MRKTKRKQSRGRPAARTKKKTLLGRSAVKRSNKARRRVIARRSLPIHKRFLLNPITVMIILITGVLIVGWTYNAIADSFTVTGTIEAAPLQDGATITSPDDGSALDYTPINVSGTCPDDPDGVYVKLYDNNTFVGVAYCSSTNAWQIETDLFTGQNDLIAQDFNITDEQGPTTPGVTVTYEPAAANSPSSSSSNSSTSTTSPTQSTPSTPQPSTSPTSPTTSTGSPPLLILSDFHYQTFTVGNSFSWVVDLEGGVPPYKLVTDWGDGTSSTQTYKTDPTVTIMHVYKKDGYFRVMLHLTDAKGNKRNMQLAALIAPPDAKGIINFNTIGNPQVPQAKGSLSNFLNNTKQWLWVAWPAYLVVVLMLLSFWLGEKEEYQHFFHHRRISKYPAHSYRNR